MKNNNVLNAFVLPDWPKEKPLFKYLKKEHSEKLFNDGELRIGTLYDFRKQEQYGPKIGDQSEGKKEIFEKIEHEFIEDPSNNNQLSLFVKQFIHLADTAKNITIANCSFSHEHKSDNCYIYCMSKEFNDKLYEEFETDVCIKIKSPYKFIEYISKSMKQIGVVQGFKICPIEYTSRRKAYGKHDEYHPSVIKDRCYSNQKEVRAIWQSQEINVTNGIIKIPVKCIKRYCEVYHEKNKLF